MKDRAQAVHEAYDSIDGIECNPVQGAMYAFPRINLPQKAIDKAKVKLIILFLFKIEILAFQIFIEIIFHFYFSSNDYQ